MGKSVNYESGSHEFESCRGFRNFYPPPPKKKYNIIFWSNIIKFENSKPVNVF